MTQPDLFSQALDHAQPHRKPGHVTRSSVLAYQERPRDARAAAVVDALSRYWVVGIPATSAELAVEMYGRRERTPPVELLLYVRRGLSDALKLGLVEHAGERKCAVSGRQCVTWRVRGR